VTSVSNVCNGAPGAPGKQGPPGPAGSAQPDTTEPPLLAAFDAEYRGYLSIKGVTGPLTTPIKGAFLLSSFGLSVARAGTRPTITLVGATAGIIAELYDHAHSGQAFTEVQVDVMTKVAPVTSLFRVLAKIVKVASVAEVELAASSPKPQTSFALTFGDIQVSATRSAPPVGGPISAVWASNADPQPVVSAKLDYSLNAATSRVAPAVVPVDDFTPPTLDAGGSVGSASLVAKVTPWMVQLIPLVTHASRVRDVTAVLYKGAMSLHLGVTTKTPLGTYDLEDAVPTSLRISGDVATLTLAPRDFTWTP
jgi:hypothetical protein